jgi:hypothetical protein
VDFEVEEELVHYDPERRRAWPEGGDWPHSNHFGFNEAVVASHFLLRGYHVVGDYCSTSSVDGRRARAHYTSMVHDVVGSDVSEFLKTDLAALCPDGSGEPDLFVFREETPNDPKIAYSNPLLWFFAEVKGPGDQVRDTQTRWWRAVAERTDIGLGPERIRLFRTAPAGEIPELLSYRY